MELGAWKAALLDQAIIVHSNRALEAAKMLNELQLDCCKLAVRLELGDGKVEESATHARVQVHVDLEYLFVRLLAGWLAV